MRLPSRLSPLETAIWSRNLPPPLYVKRVQEYASLQMVRLLLGCCSDGRNGSVTVQVYSIMARAGNLPISVQIGRFFQPHSFYSFTSAVH
jgi:hypothetical protein